jgi:hypothetical protein
VINTSPSWTEIQDQSKQIRAMPSGRGAPSLWEDGAVQKLGLFQTHDKMRRSGVFNTAGRSQKVECGSRWEFQPDGQYPCGQVYEFLQSSKKVEGLISEDQGARLQLHPPQR